MKKIRKAEAHCFTIQTAAAAANTTPEAMAEHLRKLCLHPDESGEINLSLLFYAIRLQADPIPLVPTPAMERNVEKVFRRITQAAFAPR